MKIVARVRGDMLPRHTCYAVRVIGRPYHYVADHARDELGFEPGIDTQESTACNRLLTGFQPQSHLSLIVRNRCAPYARVYATE